eukprot:5794443-Amphidinium_carterae.1
MFRSAFFTRIVGAVHLGESFLGFFGVLPPGIKVDMLGGAGGLEPVAAVSGSIECQMPMLCFLEARAGKQLHAQLSSWAVGMKRRNPIGNPPFVNAELGGPMTQVVHLDEVVPTPQATLLIRFNVNAASLDIEAPA